MARKKSLEWTDRAKREWVTILAYYEERNGSPRYGKRLAQDVARRLGWVQQGLTQGQNIAIKGVRMICQDAIVVLYKEDAVTVWVVRVFDARQDVKFL
ncbi:MAG: type II toxin-antitoxin system RelE/ParE family toxin [Thermoguttaceae bacterium]